MLYQPLTSTAADRGKEKVKFFGRGKEPAGSLAGGLVQGLCPEPWGGLVTPLLEYVTPLDLSAIQTLKPAPLSTLRRLFFSFGFSMDWLNLSP
jgi:hypothetical protein